MFRAMGGGNAFSTEIPQGVRESDVQICDQAVRALPSVLRVVVIEYYQRHTGGFDRCMRETARACGIDKGTLRRYLSSAHASIADHLGAVTCGA
jgi:DNA-directed RNA polymerase specialized sigma24 family protein